MPPIHPLLILCGGHSRRMGQPKALLPYQGQSLIARQVANALPQRPVWLAAADARYPDTEGAHYLPDRLPDRAGALSAIAPALQQAKQQGYGGLYVFSCDTLLLPETLIAALDAAQHHSEWTSGTILFRDDNEQMLPLLAHWSSALADALSEAVDAGQNRVQWWVKSRPHRLLPLPQGWQPLSNFNTPAEFQAAVAAAGV